MNVLVAQRSGAVCGLLVMAAVAVALTPTRAAAAAGDLDPGFGVGGVVTTDTSGVGASDEARAVAVAPDGSSVAVGMAITGAATDVVIARYTTAGVLDSSFGSAGVVVLPVLDSYDIGYAVIFDAAGRIVVAAQSVRDGQPVPVLLRLLPDGSRDESFGDAGQVLVDGASTLRSLEIDGRGGILAAGFSQVGRQHSILVRFTDTGAIDDSFGDTGVTTAPGLTWAWDIALQEDGRILTTGWGISGGIVAARFLADGRLDPNYGVGGEAVFPLSPEQVTSTGAVTVAVQPDQKAVLGGSWGSGGPDFLVARLNVDGTPDRSFSGDGLATVAFQPDAEDIATSIEVASDGAIIASGYTASAASGVGAFAVARFTPGGSLDLTFSADGRAEVDVSGAPDHAYGAVLSPHGLTLAGSNNGGYNDPAADVALARVQVGTLGDNPNPPTLSPVPAQRVAEGGTLAFKLRGSDPDKDPISFWAEPLPVGARLDSNGRFRWTPDYSQAGRYELVLHASDNYAGHTATTRVAVTVTDTTIATRLEQDVRVRRSIDVDGRLRPAPAGGGEVAVEFYVKTNQTFDLIDARTVPLTNNGRYTTTFTRPEGRSSICRIDTIFGGQDPWQPSATSTTVRC